MNQSEHSYFHEELNNMQGIDINALVASRLEDIADQVDYLLERGDTETAEFLREEGYILAEACDNDDLFFFVNDLTAI